MFLFSKKSVPNVLTFLRLTVVPLTLAYILQDELVLAFCFFSFAAVTDYVDGYLARRWQVESRFGRLFDPVADKALLMGSYIALTYTGHIPDWLMDLIVGRDILIIMGALMVYLFNLPVRLSPLFISKVNTFFQLILVSLVLMTDFSFYDGSFYDFCDKIPAELYERGMWILLSLTTLTTILSGIEYIFYFVRGNLRGLLRRFWRRQS
jgi:cardiolipin synthase (CMP-forming)